MNLVHVDHEIEIFVLDETLLQMVVQRAEKVSALSEVPSSWLSLVDEVIEIEVGANQTTAVVVDGLHIHHVSVEMVLFYIDHQNRLFDKTDRLHLYLVDVEVVDWQKDHHQNDVYHNYLV